ncbi:tRNA (adenosine(37)-N6)-threonylcarbamoyltransferase complex ATPase subunit type 1 TsaE [Brevibacterium sp. UCMA 11752]|uniref:tRNA (adenosine(37)-N6)-threonylcarbamoyltransferase complex ATPase subunit type 1 TsaE n=1 Tax=Brevibacterium sp. UCMA 11752 TaxID=2745946 RepID=UPI001F02B570|nr:tRNA (adenosine(37)-N6)-threonylcarbamoyltransferase complex ATPase subunit type 1 TsaE [Brevibacterium sp. UCMA 11752]MCF2587379.1 tRNA (adenosine(37)-N6)-threonylcarbamoyltransferase complex ATPase subunit type 1 TsaE [Brevibacterium sp. UCMA 11752]
MKLQLTSLDQMRTFAELLAGHLRAGDLLILSGNLGAGKTTFTQSLGRALGVAGRITSPTFVIAREHPSLHEGPALVHVDAYRLSGAEELGDLDLDSELEESITVVEWGAGLAEQLSSDYLGLTITPMFDLAADGSGAEGDATADDDADEAAEKAAEDDADEDERRLVELHGHGSSWDARLQRVRDSLRTLAGAIEVSEFDGSDGSADEEDSQ